MKTPAAAIAAFVALVTAAACGGEPAAAPPRASGYVEATETQIASQVPGRVSEVRVEEGDRVAAGDVLAVISTTDVELALRRARADRDQASAQLRLLLAGARSEDLDQAEAQLQAAAAERTAAEADLEAAEADAARFERLVRNGAGAGKARDDAVARRDRARASLAASGQRVRAAEAALARLRAGARPEEVQAARARLASADAQLATLEHDLDEAIIHAPSAGIVATRLAEPGELVGRGQALLSVIDLDRAWVNAYVEEPIVPTLRLGGGATVVTDAGDELAGRITFISPRAEFTPRNVQTSEERAKLVYRVKVGVDNREGVLKPGMPVDVRFATEG